MPLTAEEILSNEAVRPDPLTDKKPELKKINTIIIMSDEHNPMYSSPYGHPFVKTPVMQWMADNGTVYENAYTPCPLCMPTRSSFLSGLRVYETQVYENTTLGHRHDFPNYGSVLNGQGVHTTYIGRMDAYNFGENMGFNEAIHTGDRNSDKKVEDYANKKHHMVRKPLDQHNSAPIGYGIKENEKSDVIPTGLAIEWIKEQSATIEKPWVLTVGLFKPHFPHYTSKEYWDMYEGLEDLPKYGKDEATGQHPYAADQRAYYNTNDYDEETVKGNRRGYYARVTHLDHQIGQIIEALKESGQMENTNVIYISDHGDMLGKFGLWKKNTLLEDSLRVPVIAIGPDFKKGARVKTPVDLHDVQAAAFKACNAIRPAKWAGTPLQEIDEDDKEKVVFSEYYGHGVRASAFMIRKGDWKLMYHFNAPHQLFNLADDPDELKNLYNENKSKADELEAELRKICDPEAENIRSFEAFGDEFVPEITKV